MHGKLTINLHLQITNKLSGTVAGTALWATSVGNERGEVLMCVLTAQEGAGLDAIAIDLMSRYATDGVPAPAVMYVDRDCCFSSVSGSWKRHFA